MYGGEWVHGELIANVLWWWMNVRRAHCQSAIQVSVVTSKTFQVHAGLILYELITYHSLCLSHVNGILAWCLLAAEVHKGRMSVFIITHSLTHGIHSFVQCNSNYYITLGYTVRYCATVIPCHCDTEILCHCYTVIPCHCDTMPLWYRTTVPLRYRAAVILCHCDTVPLWYFATVITYHCDTVRDKVASWRQSVDAREWTTQQVYLTHNNVCQCVM